MTGLRMPAFAVGDADRRRIGTATVTCLWTAAAFVLYLWIGKEVRPLYLHEPWQDDPYDAAVSFAFFFVPILAGLCVIRAALCKRDRPLPVRRARELLIACRLITGIAGVTLLVEWLSVALGVHRDVWNSTTDTLFLALGAMTLVVVLSAALVSDALRRTPDADLGPDWWSDASAVVDEYWGQGRPLGSVLPSIARASIDSVARLVRTWPLPAAAPVSVGFGVALATVQSLAEDGFAPSVFFLYLSVAAASMFAFLLAAGAHLHLAGPRPRLSGRSRRLADSAAAAAAVFAAALAFRAPLQAVGRLAPGHGAGRLLLVCALTGVATAVAVYVTESVVGMHSRRIAQA
jgi:hypothetical protein